MYLFNEFNYSSWHDKIYNGGNVNHRKLVELPHHLLQLKDQKRLTDVICDFQFIQASFVALKNFDLLHYYSQAIGIHYNA